MNKFLDDLKYNVNSVAHKAKKGLLVGGLSLMAASSFIGCSKATSDKPTTIEQTQEQDTSELEKRFDYLSKNADELISELEAYPSSTLSDEETLKVSNFLLDYVFTKTSQNFGGEIPATVMIPNKNNNLLDGTFKIPEDEREKYFQVLQENDVIYFNDEAVDLYNSYTLDETSLRKALSSVYTVKADLIEKNPELLDDLSYEDMLNLIKSSYVSAYNNQNDNEKDVRAVDTTIHINKLNDLLFSISTSLEPTIKVTSKQASHDTYSEYIDEHTNDSTVINDYKDACIAYYLNDSNSSMLDSLQEANEKYEVTTEEVIDQLMDINRQKAQENQTTQSTPSQTETDEISR